MILENDSYYWVLVLDSGKFEVGKYVNGYWALCGSGRPYSTSDMGQIGQKIPSTDELFEQSRAAL